MREYADRSYEDFGASMGASLTCAVVKADYKSDA